MAFRSIRAVVCQRISPVGVGCAVPLAELLVHRHLELEQHVLGLQAALELEDPDDVRAERRLPGHLAGRARGGRRTHGGGARGRRTRPGSARRRGRRRQGLGHPVDARAQGEIAEIAVLLGHSPHLTAPARVRRSRPCCSTSTRLSTEPPSAANAIHVQGWAHDPDSPVRDVTVLVDEVPARPGRTDVAAPRRRRGLRRPTHGVVRLRPRGQPAAPLRAPGAHTVAVEARLLDGRSARSSPVTVRLAATPALPEEHAAPSGLRSHVTGVPVRSVWLARSLDQVAPSSGWRRPWSTWPGAAGPPPSCRRQYGPAPATARARRGRRAGHRPSPARRRGRPTGGRWRRWSTTWRTRTSRSAATVTSFPLVDAARLAGVPAVQRIGEEAPLAAVVAWLIGRLDPEVEEHARRAISSATMIWTNAHTVAAAYREHGYGDRLAVIHTGAPRPDPATRLPVPRPDVALACPRIGGCSSAPARSGRSRGRGCSWRPRARVRTRPPRAADRAGRVRRQPVRRPPARPPGGARPDRPCDHRAVPHDLSTWWSAADVVALTPHSPSEALSGVPGRGDGARPACARDPDRRRSRHGRGRSVRLAVRPRRPGVPRRRVAPGRERRPVDPARVRRVGRPALCPRRRPGDGARPGRRHAGGVCPRPGHRR